MSDLIEEKTDERPPIRQRVRIRFGKQDDLRWASHRDLMRLWERLFRRAGCAARNVGRISSQAADEFSLGPGGGHLGN